MKSSNNNDSNVYHHAHKLTDSHSKLQNLVPNNNQQSFSQSRNGMRKLQLMSTAQRQRSLNTTAIAPVNRYRQKN